MLRILLTLFLALMMTAPVALPQTYDGTESPSATPLGGPLRSAWVPVAGDDKLIAVEDLDGAFVKSITTAGLATVQLADNSEVEVQLNLAGGNVGQEQVEDFVGALIAAGTQSGITVTYVDNDGNAGELNFTVAGGGTVTLSDAAPENITNTGSAGTSTDVSRADHAHGGYPGFSTTAPVNVTTGSGAVGTSTQLSRSDHIHGGDVVRTLSNANPEDVGNTASSGTSTTVSREDHVHAGGDITSVGTTAPLTGGGTAGDVTVAIRAASPTQSGSMSAADKTKLDGVAANATANAGDVTSVTVSAPLTGGGNSGDLTVALPDATTTTAGAMSSADKTKLDGVAAGATANTGDITEVGTTAPLTGGGTAGSVTIAISPASTTAAGSMSAADKTKLDGLEEQIELIDSLNDVTYTQADNADLSSRFGGATVYTAELDAAGTADAEINDLIVFQWRDNPAGVPDTRPLGIRINDTGTTLPIRIIDPLTNSLTNKTRADLTRYEFLFLSRQDGVFIQLSTLELSAAMSRLLPASPSDDQIARYDSATSAWVAENLPAGVASTFLGLTDTPTAYTDASRYLLRVNGGSTGVEFIPEPANDNTIPHVSRLPGVADDSPVLVFLTHDELDGDREDATLTVGEALGQYCGYSNGDIFQAFGSISKASPIDMIFGIWDGTDCTIQTVHSANEGFIDDIRSVIFTVAGGTEATCQLGDAFQEYGYETKRILSCPGLEDIGTVDVTINFLYEDGTSAYWTDGSRTHRAGLYEKVGTPPVYHDLAPPEDAHKTGEGSAACGDSEPPDAAGQICVTSDGRGYFAMPRTSLETTPATITVTAAGSDLFIPDLYEPSDLQNRVGLTDGQFIYVKTSQDFYQFQDPDFVVVSWTQAWQYIVSNVGDTATRQTFLASVFLGEFASENEVLRDRDGYTDDSVEYYFLYSDFGTLIHISAFTNSVTEEIDAGFAWRGPVIIPEEVLDVVAANDTEEIDGVLDSILIGSQRYSVIVRPGENGQLRDPIAADYDTTYARSKVVAVVDGEPYKVRRTLVSGHTATGTFTEVAVNTELPAGGSGTYRWRGVYTADQDVSSPREDDIYYNIQYHHWRVRDHDDVYGDYWYTLPNGGEILTRLNWVDYFTSEADALGHATAMGQRFVLPDGNDWALYTLTAFTAAEPAHYEYSWTEAVPPPVLPENDTLVDNLAVTFTGARRPSVEVKFSRGLLEADDGRPVIIDYRPNAANSNTRAPGGAILAEHFRTLTSDRPFTVAKQADGTIDQSTELSGTRGGLEFPFPLSSAGNDLHWMRFYYIGDHHANLAAAVVHDATSWTLDDTSDVEAGEIYWVLGDSLGDPTCPNTSHYEKVRVTSVDTGTTITVERGLDNTGLDSRCNYITGTDLVLDDKRTFVLAPTHDDQDSGNFTFTLLAQGVGGQAGQADAGSGGGGILLQKHLVSSSTLVDVDSTTWETILTQAVTVAGATDRVFVDAVLTIEATSTDTSCDIRIIRGTDEVAIVEGDIGFSGEIQHIPIRALETPGAGTYTYNIQVREGDVDDCEVNVSGTSSFMTTEILSANP